MLPSLQPKKYTRDELKWFLNGEVYLPLQKHVALQYAEKLYGVGMHPVMSHIAEWKTLDMHPEFCGVRLLRSTDAYTSAAVYNPTESVFTCGLYVLDVDHHTLHLVTPIQNIVPGFQVFELLTNILPVAALPFHECWICFRDELTGQMNSDAMRLSVRLRSCIYEYECHEKLVQGPNLLLTRDCSKIIKIEQGCFVSEDDLTRP